MKLTGKQAHVLQNLERVTQRPYRVNVPNPIARYDLDGWECTSQITGLTVRGAIEHQSDGKLARCGATPSRGVPT